MNPRQRDLGDVVSWLSVALIGFYIIDRSLPLLRAVAVAVGVLPMA